MQRILIVEDNRNQLDTLCAWIQEEYLDWDIHLASNYQEASMRLKESIRTGQIYNLFLLDVQLSQDSKERGGFNLAFDIRKESLYFSTPLLFLTSVSDEISFALSNFHCYNYITKPYEKSDIIEQIEQLVLTGFLKETSLSITDEFHIYHKIPFEDIIYIQTATAHTLTLHTKETSITITSYSLDSIMKLLGDEFFRCHKKYIVNLTHIENYDATNRCITIDKISISVGRTYKDTFKKRWGCFSR